MSGCRIGRVRMKAGGADVRVLHSERPEGLGAKLLASARRAALNRNVVGYALVCVDDTGHLFSACRTDWPEEALINRHAFVGMAIEAIREDMITDEAARTIVNRANGFDE